MKRMILVVAMVALGVASIGPAQAADAPNTPIVFTCKGTVGYDANGVWEFRVDSAPGPLVVSTCIAENEDTANPNPPPNPTGSPGKTALWLNGMAPVGMADGSIRGVGDITCGNGTLTEPDGSHATAGNLTTGNFGSNSSWGITDLTATFTNGVGDVSGTVEGGSFHVGHNHTRVLSGTVVLDDNAATCSNGAGNAIAVLVLE